jgi:hypothetical protein
MFRSRNLYLTAPCGIGNFYNGIVDLPNLPARALILKIRYDPSQNFLRGIFVS